MDLTHYEDRELLLSRCQDLKWTDDVSGFQCVRCERVLIRHYIANCGHKFCFNCKKLVGDGSKRWRCPIKECNKFIEDIHLQDGFFEETVFELNTHCPNHKYGCPIIGPLKDIESHLSKCEDTRENAMPVLYKENKQMNDIQMLKKISEMSEKMETMNSTVTEMQKAMSEMREEKLGEKLVQEKMAEMENKGTEQGMKLANMDSKWTTTNRKLADIDSQWGAIDRKINGVAMDLREMSAKIVSNTNEETKKTKANAEEILKLKGKSENWLEMLDFKDKKCNEKINQLEIEMKKISQQHQNEISTLKKESNSMSAQNQLLTDQFQLSKQRENEWKKRENELQNEIEAINKKLSEFNGREEALEKSFSALKPHINLRNLNLFTKHEPDLIWRINSIKNKVKKTNFELLSTIFPLKGYPFGAQAKLTLKSDNFIYVTLSYKDINESGKKLDLKLIPSVHYAIKGQSSNAKIIKRELYYLYTSVMQYDAFTYERWIIEFNKLVSDTISIEIHVEPSDVTQRGNSYDGSITWAIDDFRVKRESEIDDLVWHFSSPYFYTSPKGYRVQARMMLNGHDAYQDKGLTVVISFLTGPYDADLSESFKHKTTVTLFHPADSSKHVVKNVEQNIDKQRLYTIDMGTHEEIEKLLDNDTLYYQINIVPA